MGEFLVAVAAKIGIALAEAIILRVVWELWAAYVRPLLRAAPAPAAA